jgi:hypothetical protein
LGRAIRQDPSLAAPLAAPGPQLRSANARRTNFIGEYLEGDDFELRPSHLTDLLTILHRGVVVAEVDFCYRTVATVEAGKMRSENLPQTLMRIAGQEWRQFHLHELAQGIAELVDKE